MSRGRHTAPPVALRSRDDAGLQPGIAAASGHGADDPPPWLNLGALQLGSQALPVAAFVAGQEGYDVPDTRTRGSTVRRAWLKILVVAAVVMASAVYVPAAAAATTLTSNVSAKLTLATGQTVNASGDIALTIQQFSVNDDAIVLVGRVDGTVTADGLTATFANVRVVAQVRNVQANCSAGTLSFHYRVVVPTRGITVTVDGTEVALRGAVTLGGSVTISTAQIAAIDPDLATAVGELICDIETVQQTGGSLEAIVDDLNAILVELSTLV